MSAGTGTIRKDGGAAPQGGRCGGWHGIVDGLRGEDDRARFQQCREPSRAEMIAVSLPEGVERVEEFLLGGIEPSQVQWVA